MDILNFISWIRGGRKFTNVDPNTTLLPVGVRDNRRDDKYLAGGISVADFANDLGVGIEIPKIIAKAAKSDVQAHLDFYQTTEWQKHNPRVFLFRTRKPNRKKKNGVRVNYGSGFYHPVHLGAVNTKFFGGESQFAFTDGGTPIMRHTEFTLPTTVPYSKFMMSDIGLDKYEWVNYIYTGEAPCKSSVIISGETSIGMFGPFTVYAVGAMNGKPYYNINIWNGVEGINYVLYWDSVNNWVLTPQNLVGTGQFDITSTLDTDCPYGENGSGYNIVNETNVIEFLSFSVTVNTNAGLKRQSVEADFAGYTPYQIGGDGGGLGFSFSMASRHGFGYRDISCPDLCFNQAYNDRSLSTQKLKFKLAIVIDNPNPTPESPYLIGPMSDTFVLKFGRLLSYNSLPLGFTNDNASEILMK